MYKINVVNRSIIVAVLFCIISACSKNEKPYAMNVTNDIIVNYNEEDFKRIEYFVSSFNDGKADYLLVIPPIIDGGYWIYDLFTDGNEIKIRIDSSRDFYSDRKNHEFTCKEIAIVNEKTDEGKGRRILEANSCKGTDAIDKLEVLVLEETK